MIFCAEHFVVCAWQGKKIQSNRRKNQEEHSLGTFLCQQTKLCSQNLRFSFLEDAMKPDRIKNIPT